MFRGSIPIFAGRLTRTNEFIGSSFLLLVEQTILVAKSHYRGLQPGRTDGWLVGWFVSWLVGWFVSWLVGLLVGWLKSIYQLAHVLIPIVRLLKRTCYSNIVRLLKRNHYVLIPQMFV